MALVLCVAMVLSTMSTLVFAYESYPTENWIDYANTDWYTGDKTTYVINSAEELAGLARLVNNGEAFTTVEFNDIIVKLGSNIDLDGKQWTPIGNLGGDKSGDTGHYSFSGVFDGDNKIVSNLCIYSKNTTEKKYANFGLFGSIGSYSESRKTTLKNLTVNNATVVCLDDQSQLGSSVAAVAGNANANITIDNVHVIGDIYIKGWSFVGGIVGHGYPTMKNCTVKATGTIITNQWCNGCLIGYLGEGPDVSDCVVEGQGEKGITLQSAMAGVGGAIGRTNGGNKIERVHVSGVNIQTSTWYAENYGAGYVASGADTPEDSCSAENVIIKGDNDETLTPDDGDSIDVIVAYVGDVYYTTLQEAIEAAAPSGTVEIVADVTVDTWKMFWPGSSDDQCIGVEINGLKINGNGHSLTVNSIVSKGNGNQLFKNVENLNISDLTINIVDGAGGIELKSGTIENVTFNGGTYAIYPGGDNLTINNCTFNNLNGTAIYYEKAYENLIVTNNTFNSPEKNAIILRGDETFTGNNIIASRGVTVANSSSATISNNTFADDVRIKVYNESTAEITDNTLTKIEFESEEEPVNATFAGNILSDTAKDVLARVGLVSVAKIGNAEYCSLADALDAASDMEGEVTITLLGDAEWETGAAHGSTPLVPAESKATVTIDGNGNTITATGAGVGSLRAANGTTLTFKNVTFEDESVSYAEDSWELGYLEFAGKLEFENCDFVSAISIDADNGQAPVTSVIFNGCNFDAKVSSEYAVWFGNGSVEFNDCYFTGTRAIKIHECYGSQIDSVKIEGCEFKDLSKKPGVVIGDIYMNGDTGSYGNNTWTDTSDTSIEITNCIFDNVQPGDQGMYIYETDTNVKEFDFSFSNNILKNLAMITFDYDGGVDNDDNDKKIIVAKLGAGINAPTDITKEGYAFVGWSPKFSPTVMGPVTYTAQWSSLIGFSAEITATTEEIDPEGRFIADVAVSGGDWNQARMTISYDKELFIWNNLYDNDIKEDADGNIVITVYGKDRIDGKVAKKLSFTAKAAEGLSHYTGKIEVVEAVIGTGDEAVTLDERDAANLGSDEVTIVQTFKMTLGEGLSGNSTANTNENYVGIITDYINDEDYEYVVKGTSGDEEVEAEVNGDEFTLAKEDIKGDTVLELTRKLKGIETDDIEIKQYVAGHSIIVLTAATKNYTYGGAKMYVTEYYDTDTNDTTTAYAYLVKGEVTKEEALLKLGLTSDALTTITTDDYDVNGTGVLDLHDVQAAWNFYNVSDRYDVYTYMDKYLNADVNNDMVVNAADIADVFAAYKTPQNN